VTPLLALADRVEQAEGPSRELDAAVVAALNLRSFVRQDRHYISLARGEIWLSTWRIGKACVDTFEGEVPAFTESIDAAAMLVPEGFAFGCGCGTEEPNVEGWGWCGPDEGPYAFAATPALALCCAALRARAAIAMEVGK